MLVLTRKYGEKIYIGEDICIIVTEIDGNKVRLGIEAPDDMPIFREEVRPPLEQRLREGRKKKDEN